MDNICHNFVSIYAVTKNAWKNELPKIKAAIAADKLVTTVYPEWFIIRPEYKKEFLCTDIKELDDTNFGIEFRFDSVGFPPTFLYRRLASLGFRVHAFWCVKETMYAGEFHHDYFENVPWEIWEEPLDLSELKDKDGYVSTLVEGVNKYFGPFIPE